MNYSKMPLQIARAGLWCGRNRDGCVVGKRSPRRGAPTKAARRICRAGAEGVFRRNAISRESPVHQRQVGGLEPTVAREHVCGPDVISTATVNGAREGARVEIMSVGCPQTAGRASRSGQVPDYLSRNTPRRVRATAIKPLTLPRSRRDRRPSRPRLASRGRASSPTSRRGARGGRSAP